MSKKLFVTPIVVVILASLVLSTAVAAPPPQSEGTTYTIQKDDWLSKLADKEYGDLLAYTAIFYFNNLMAEDDDSLTVIDDPDLIEVGWTIYLPSPEEAAEYLAENPPGGSDDDADNANGNANDDDMANANGNANDDDMVNANGNSNDDDGSNSNDDDGSNSNSDDGSNSNNDDGSNSNNDDDSNSNDDN